jgi:ribosomal protein S18 acetylase RimI-like enzyme
MSDSQCLDPVPWETRNLGLAAFAIGADFFREPDERMLKRCLEAAQRAHGDVFVQARCKPDTNTSQILEASGFYFVEATVCPRVVFAKYAVLDRFVADPRRVLPARYKAADVDVVLVTAAHRDMVAAIRMVAGEAFTDDRFHVDHNCDAETANRRYRFWVDDLFGDPAVRFRVLTLQRQPVAFMASRRSDLVLAGFAPTYASSGLGEFFWLRVLEELRRDGVKSVSSLISLNNISALNLYARLRFKFREPRTTFHFWARSTTVGS